jgi:superfamily II DNA/RNA helicase
LTTHATRSSGASRDSARSGSGGGGPRRRPRAQGGGRSSRPAPVAEKSPLDRALDASAATELVIPESFGAFGLPPRLVDNLEQRGITVPTAIQARTLGDSLAGRDVLGRASTGSGKTLAFGIPLLARLAQSSKAVPTKPSGLVLVPTRELAEQVRNALAPLAQTIGRTVTAVYGGASIPSQINALARGVDVVVATPGRLEDLIARKSCDLSQVEITVLDEADYMADLGFMPAVTRLLDQVPDGGQRLLFSATLDRGVDALVRRYLVDPAVHAVASADTPVESMDHLGFEVGAEDKPDVAAVVAARHGRTLIFVRTKHGADRLAKRLDKAGLAAAAIHGNRSQGQRQRALDDFAAGRVPVLVATDVAARGIHVDGVDLVVHYDPPADHKDYLHRSGRTARAGARGTVLSLVVPGERRDAEAMHRKLSTGAAFVPVTTDSEPVRELVESGTPIVVIQRPVARAEHGYSDAPGQPRRSGGPRRDGVGGRGSGGRGGSGRPGSGGAGGGRGRGPRDRSGQPRT